MMEEANLVANELQVVRRALANEYILGHVFGFLSVDDIKSCREVNRTWKNVGSQFIRQRTEVNFELFPGGFSRRRVIEKVNLVTKYANSYVVDDTSRYSPFSSFFFYGDVHVNILSSFMKRGHSVVRNLGFEGKVLSDQCEKILELKRLIHPNLESILLYLQPKAPFFCNLPPKGDYYLQVLDLDNCDVFLFEDIRRLALKKISLGSHNQYFLKSLKLKKFVVNSLFDFRATNVIDLEGPGLVLDLGIPLGDKTNRGIHREIELTKVQLMNWEKCDWRVHKLSLSVIPFLTNTSMEIEELRLLKSKADLTVLKHNDKLKVLTLLEDTRISYNNFTLPNLSHLSVEAKEACYVIPLFSKSKKLNYLSLYHPNFPLIVNTMEMDISLRSVNFPNVRTFQLNGAVFDDVYRFEQLIVNDCELMNHDFLYKQGKFDYQTLIVDDRIIPRISPLQYLYVLSCKKEYMNRLLVGPFGWIRWRVQIP